MIRTTELYEQEGFTITKAPPEIKLRFDFSIKEIETIISKVIQIETDAIASILLVELKDATFQSIAIPLAEVENEHQPIVENIRFFAKVSNDIEIVNTVNNLFKRLLDHRFHKYGNRDLFIRLKRVHQEISKQGLAAAKEKRFLEKLLVEFENHGIKLSLKDNHKLKELIHLRDVLSSKYEHNLRKSEVLLHLHRSELKGVPTHNVKEFKRLKNDRYEVFVTYRSYVMVSRYCDIEETRQKFELAYYNRAKCLNMDLLKKLFSARRQIARLLGYDSYAHLALSRQITSSPSMVYDFLKELDNRAHETAMKEYEDLLQFKRKFLGGFDVPLFSWDLQYFSRKLTMTFLETDEEYTNQFFSVDRTVLRVLKVFERILNLEIRFVESSFPLWHPDIAMLEVHSIQSGTRTSLLGFMLLDLYFRKEKHLKACCYVLQNGSFNSQDGSKCIRPIVAVVCAFDKPDEEVPTFLSHEQVESLFHEFGHAFHCICAKTPFATFGSVNVERDFVELPAHIFEYYARDWKTLREISGHYLDENQKLPLQICKALCKAKYFGFALKTKRQILFAKFDQLVHTYKTEALNDLFYALWQDILPYKTNERICIPVTFVHLIGYGALYYGYLLSAAYAADIYFNKLSAPNSEEMKKSGTKLKDLVFMPGSSKDGLHLLEDYLGRLPSTSAYYSILTLGYLWKGKQKESSDKDKGHPAGATSALLED